MNVRRGAEADVATSEVWVVRCRGVAMTRAVAVADEAVDEDGELLVGACSGSGCGVA